MSLEIRELPAAKLAEFVDYPYGLFRGHPHWCGELKKDTLHLLDNAHPFWLHSEKALYMAYRDGRPAGRLAAIVNRAHNSFHCENLGFFGFFDCADDPAAAAGLFDAAEKYLRAKGMDAIRGPVNPSTNETCGLLAEGFDGPPMVMMPYNPPYYERLIADSGFAKAKDLLAWRLDMSKPFSERFDKIARRVARSGGVKIEFVRPGGLDRAIADIKEIYNAAWDKNWGFVPMTDAEFTAMAAAMKPVLKPDYLFFATVDGKPAAFTLLLPDLNVPLKAAHGSLNPLTILPFLWKMFFGMKAGRLLTLGVKKEFRNRGLEVLLIKEAFEAGRRMNWEYGEMSWTLEDNDQINGVIEALGGTVYRKYRLFDKTLR
jgi:GNAT superfamily N-acetyltransferase